MTTKAHNVNTPHPATPGSAPLVTISLDTVIGHERYYNEDFDSYDGRDITIADAIVNQAAATLAKELKPEIVKHVIAKADEQIVTQVRALVAEVLVEPFSVTDEWGHRSEPTSFRQRIGDQVAKELKPSRHDSYSSRDKATIDTVIEQEVKAALHKELSGAVKEARDKVVGSVRDNAAAMFSAALKDGLR